MRTWRLIAPHWIKSSAPRERRRFGHLAAALPHFVRRGNRAREPVYSSRDSANGIPGASAAEHAKAVRDWTTSLPAWARVQSPRSLDLSLSVDAGELEAICLAREIDASALLIDDLAGRAAAVQCGLVVIGTVGLLERAASRGLLDLPDAMDRLRQTNARIHPDLIQEALRRDAARKAPPQT